MEAYANTDGVALTNNGIMHLFRQITYQLSNQDKETVFSPGQATTMLGMLNYSNDFQLAQGLNQLWYKDNTTTAVLADKGLQQDKLANVAAGKVNFSKISLFKSHEIPADAERFNLYKQIESKVTIPVSFRSRQCDTIAVPQATIFSWRLSVRTSPENSKYIIVGFQTNKSGDQTANPSLFDCCDLKNMYIMLNQERYPAVDYNLSFPNQQIPRIYSDAAVFKENFYGMNELITNSNIDPSDYKDLFPLIVFNVSYQSERLKSSTIDVQIKATFNSAVPAGTQANVVVLSDRIIEFQSDGNKMNVVY
ncbi:uncharacterized protein LOC136076052 [Hydra vulgaris]|uniref:Uncharacterized protein LOC136076052 n=1 Tax=Hydra vulgaris TaxID=6087 RepID=A0ABM4B9L1_HYDVU